MAEPASSDVTRLLQRAGQGDTAASDELLPLVYDELRKLAHARMAREPAGASGPTLQPTGLVHDAYLRLVGARGEQTWNGRSHFFAAAALAMRRILVERARRRRRKRHGGELARLTLGDVAAGQGADPVDLIALDEALVKLEAVDARKARIVTLRYFAGLSIEETAAALDLSPTTVKDEWTLARALLHRDLGGP